MCSRSSSAAWPDDFASLAAASLLTEIDSLGQELFSDFSELRRERAATDAVLEAWAEELSPEALGRTLTYTNTKGVVSSLPCWHAVAHLFNHQTHHRGQITALLHQLGRDPGVTDFLVMAFPPETA
jgi:uncharacterized damage-inducible protein DinB